VLSLPNVSDYDDDEVITRRILREELQVLRTGMGSLRDELGARIDRVQTNLDLAVGALVARMDAMEHRIITTLHADMASWTKAVQEQTAATLRVLDDKYAGLPPRVARLEAEVFPPRSGRRRRS
jgi:hypothetical protein